MIKERTSRFLWWLAALLSSWEWAVRNKANELAGKPRETHEIRLGDRVRCDSQTGIDGADAGVWYVVGAGTRSNTFNLARDRVVSLNTQMAMEIPRRYIERDPPLWAEAPISG